MLAWAQSEIMSKICMYFGCKIAGVLQNNFQAFIAIMNSNPILNSRSYDAIADSDKKDNE